MKNVTIGGIPHEDLQEIIGNEVEKAMRNFFIENQFGVEFKDEILSRKVAAQMFGKTPDKMSAMYERGEIPGFKSGKEYFFRKSQLVKQFKFKKK
jgi:hypothetical protein